MSGALLLDILHWAAPPASGALLGFLLGRFVLARIVSVTLARRSAVLGSAIQNAAAADQGSGESGFLAMRAASLLPAEGTDPARRLEGAIAGFVGGLLGSRQTIYAVRNAVSKLVATVSARGAGETAQQIGVQAFLADHVFAALAREGARTRIAESAARLVSERAAASMDDEVIHALSDVVDSAVPDAAEAVVRWLRSAETRSDLAERGRELLPRILQELTDLQRLFLGAAQLDRRLNEKMPEIVDLTVAALEKMVRDPRQQARVAGVFADAAQGWRSSLHTDGAESGGLESPAGAAHDRRQKLARAVSRLVDQFLASLEDPSERRRLAARAVARLQEDHRTLGSFVRDAVGLQEQEIVERISNVVLRTLTAPQAARGAASRLVDLVAARVREQPDITLAAVLGIGDTARQELEGLLRTAVADLVRRRLPTLLDGPVPRRWLQRLLGASGAAAGLLAGAGVDLLRAWGLS